MSSFDTVASDTNVHAKQVTAPAAAANPAKTPPTGRVQTVVDQLNDAMGKLVNARAALSDRIKPVLKPAGPQAGAAEAEGPRASGSPLAEQLIKLSNQLYAEIANLTSIHDAVDL